MVNPEQGGVNEVVAHGTAGVRATGEARRQAARCGEHIVVTQRRFQGPLTIGHQVAIV